MEQLDHMLGPAHEGIIDALAHQNAAHRHRAGCNALGEGENIRRYAEAFSGESRAEAAEARDHFIENQQNVIGTADVAQALEIALGWRQHAC
jgi:hypothetical protein